VQKTTKTIGKLWKNMGQFGNMYGNLGNIWKIWRLNSENEHVWLIFMIAQFVALVQEKNSFGLICWSLGSFFGYFAPTIWDCSQPDIPTMGGNI
jgi:hypothetical protein